MGLEALTAAGEADADPADDPNRNAVPAVSRTPTTQAMTTGRVARVDLAGAEGGAVADAREARQRGQRVRRAEVFVPHSGQLIGPRAI